ncbi:ATP-dependent DNA helicase [Salix suchowensis]|nr:ATP-dependent DNA helicase [Salix suchowensis]
MRTVTSNPVACARFFKFMVDVFIYEILRFDAKGPGIYGNVEAYYGTVEQQGRLSLHLHAMLWIMGSLSPQEMCANILDSDGTWCKKILQWLEGCHVGEFLTGSQKDIEDRVIKAKANVKPIKSKSKDSSTSDCDDDKDADQEVVDGELGIDDEDTDKLLSGSKKCKQTMLDFQSDHPLHATHKCALMLDTNKKLKRTVLNFMSAPPRRDQGDREYYCSVIGKELKGKDKTWDEAFLSQDFSAQHIQIMNNFNLRYECLDAKDDFRTEMKTGVDGELSLPFSDDQYVSQQCDNELEGILQSSSNIDLQLEIDKMSASALRREKAIKSMKALMQNSHWATPLLSQESTSFDSIQESYPKLPKKSPHYNYVKVVDKSYLEAAYVPSVHRELMVECVSAFCLNEEQNRAFTIVANHSVAENSGQLKMYIGGMGEQESLKC